MTPGRIVSNLSCFRQVKNTAKGGEKFSSKSAPSEIGLRQQRRVIWNGVRCKAAPYAVSAPHPLRRPEIQQAREKQEASLLETEG